GDRPRVLEDDPRAPRCARRVPEPDAFRGATAHRRPRGETPPAIDVQQPAGRGAGRPHRVWGEHSRAATASRGLRRQDPPGRPTCGPARGAAYQVRAGHQPQDGQGARPDDPAVAPAEGGSGDRVIDRRAFLGSLAGLIAAPLAAETQQSGKLYQIGILGQNAADSEETRQWRAFRQVLRERGWNEGLNIRIEYRWVEGGDAPRLQKLAADLVRLRPDLIVTRGSFFTGALKAATSSIPIVALAHADPVGTGHVASLARPGGNVTGVA